MDPPGSGASAVRVCSRPAAASFSVPSPASTATTSKSSSAAACASSVAWPRRDVSATSTSWRVGEDPADVGALARRHRRRRRVDEQEHAHRAGRVSAGRRRIAIRDPRCVPAISRRCSQRDRRSAARARDSSSGASRWRARSGPSFRDETYWARPVPGFGDPRARVLVVGLAPAAHGGNRTGRRVHRRPFGRLPVRVAVPVRLREPADVGRASTTGSCCATRTSPPPCAARRPRTSRRRPSATSARRSSRRELELLDRVRVIVALGAFGYEAVWSALRASRRARCRAAGPPAAVRAPARGAVRPRDGARRVPPEPAEHVHRPAHARRCSTRCSRARAELDLSSADDLRRPRRSTAMMPSAVPTV